MQLIIEDNDSNFFNHLNNVIENLQYNSDLYVRNLYPYIKHSNFKASFIKEDRTDYRGKAFDNGFIIYKTIYETYDSLSWDSFMN